MSRPRIHFVNRFYWPDTPATAQLLTDLAEALAGEGHLVRVLARQPGGSPASEVHQGVEIERVPATFLGRRHLPGRLLDFATFVQGVRRRLRTSLQPGDVVVSLTDPPLLSSALASLVQDAGARHVHWVQDIFPEVAMATWGQAWPGVFAPTRDRAWRKADACVVPGEAMASFVRSRGVAAARVLVCPNWAPRGLTETDGQRWRAEQGLTGRFVIMYSGNLGRVHEFSSIVPLARQLADDPAYVLLFIGAGARKAGLERAVRESGVTNVHFLPAVPRERLSEVLSAADLHLITLREGVERYVFPSKLYGVAAVGRPVVVIGPRESDLARIIQSGRFGSVFAPGETPALAGFLRTLRTDPDQRASFRTQALAFSAAAGQLPCALPVWRRLLAEGLPLAAAPGAPSDSIPR